MQEDRTHEIIFSGQQRMDGACSPKLMTSSFALFCFPKSFKICDWVLPAKIPASPPCAGVFFSKETLLFLFP